MLEARVSFLILTQDKKWVTETLNFLTINFLSYVWGVSPSTYYYQCNYYHYYYYHHTTPATTAATTTPQAYDKKFIVKKSRVSVSHFLSRF